MQLFLTSPKTRPKILLAFVAITNFSSNEENPQVRASGRYIRRCLEFIDLLFFKAFKVIGVLFLFLNSEF